MKDTFLKIFCFRGLALYYITYIVISLVFPNSFVGWHWLIWGIGGATFFFCGTYALNHFWQDKDEKKFILLIFFTALIIRILYVWLMCFYYTKMTGKPLEIGAADSYEYHQKAIFYKNIIVNGQFGDFLKFLLNNKVLYSDLGYPMMLAFIYLIFGPNVLIPRILQALMSAYICVMIYKICRRTFNIRTAKTAGVISVVMPLLIYYCGVHLKEMEFAFFLTLCVERLDFLMREGKNKIWNAFLVVFAIIMVFLFRISTGLCLMLSIFIAILVAKREIVSTKAKIIFASSVAVLFGIIMLTNIRGEILWNVRSALDISMYNFQYLPGAFVLPLPKFTADGSPEQFIKSGMVFAKNIIGFFAMYSFIVAYREKKLREISLVALLPLTYLAIVSILPLFSNERFYFPALPFLIVLAAYGMTNLKKKDLKLFNAYLIVLFVAMMSWSYINIIS